MAAVALGVNALWRPWRQAGVTHLLLEQEEALALREQATRPQQGARTQRATPPVLASAPQAVAPSRPIPSAPPAPTQAPTLPHAQAPAQTPAPEQHRAEPLAQVLPEPLPRESWPASWLERLQKTPSRPRLVWTYDRLAQDLAGLGDGKTRGVFFRSLFAELGMEQGNHALWPLAVPPGNRPDAVFFVSGLAALNPETVVFMGDDDDAAFEALDFPRISPLSTALWRGRRFVRLFGVDRLLEEPAPRRHRLLSLIKTLHRPRG